MVLEFDNQNNYTMRTWVRLVSDDQNWYGAFSLPPPHRSNVPLSAFSHDNVYGKSPYMPEIDSDGTLRLINAHYWRRYTLSDF